MKKTLKETGETSGDRSEPVFLIHGTRSRPAIGAIAIAILLVDKLIISIYFDFMQGNGWYELIVGAVVLELIVAVGLYGWVLLIWAVFAPAWLSRLFTAAYRKLTWALAFVCLLFGAAILFVMVAPILIFLGMIR